MKNLFCNAALCALLLTATLGVTNAHAQSVTVPNQQRQPQLQQPQAQLPSNVIINNNTQLGTGAERFPTNQREATQQIQQMPGLDAAERAQVMQQIQQQIPALRNAETVKQQLQAGADPQQVLQQMAPSPTLGGNFSLVDHNNRRVTSATYNGFYRLVLFGFANCPDICPAQLDVLSKAIRALPADKARRVVVLFVSVDPARDTPAVLRAFVGRFGSNVFGLTGTKAEIDAMVNQYKAYYQIRGGDAGGNDFLSTLTPAQRAEALRLDPALAKQQQAAAGRGAAAQNYAVDHSTFVQLYGPTGEFINIVPDDDVKQTTAVLASAIK